MKASNVAVLGPAGTFTGEAAQRMYPGARLEYQEDVGDVFRFVDEGRGQGVVAIENSLEGSVGKTMESLMKYDVKITGEMALDISLSLLAAPGLRPQDVRVVMSHPHALAQCKDWLQKHYPKARRLPTASTTEAMLQAKNTAGAAAVGSKAAGLMYGLTHLADDIQDQDSQTRFISISLEASDGGKTSIIFSARDEPGALFSILKVFADKGVNLTKIESRPSRKKLGEYVFYVDFENRGMDAHERKILGAKIRERTTYYKDLGSY